MEASSPGGNEGSGSRHGRMPAMDFSGFMVSMAQAALVHLGESPDPVTGRIERNIEQARYSIDLVDLLIEKTRGNLTPEEQTLVLRIQSDLKLRFVRAR